MFEDESEAARSTGTASSASSIGSVLDAVMFPEETLGWAARALPGPDVVACLAVVDVRSVSQSGRLDLLVALERQIGWLQARQTRALAALDADSPPERIQRVSVEPGGQFVEFTGCLVDDGLVDDGLVDDDLLDDAAGRSQLGTGTRLLNRTAGAQSHDSVVMNGCDDLQASSTGNASGLKGLDGFAIGARIQRARYEDPHHWIHEEIACVLTISPRSAASRVEIAVKLVNELPRTLAAIESGTVAPYSARLIAEATSGLEPARIRDFEAAVLPKAGTLTPGKLRREITRARLMIDPGQAGADHDRAVSDRRIVLTPGPDGMAELWALLPAHDAQVVYAALTRVAERMSVDPRGLNGQATPSSLAGEAVIGDRTLEQLRVDALTEVCFDLLAAPNDPAPSEPTGRDVPRTSRKRSRRGRRPVVQVTVALSTLLGLDEQAAELAGHGPIPAVLARQIAADSSGTWRRLVTDEAGRLVDYGATRYRPPRLLSDAVMAQFPTCVFPVCNRPALRCQLDHRARAADSGPTNFHNIGPLCLRHHQAKDTLGWALHREADGAHVWTSPTGRRFRTPFTPLPHDATGIHRTGADGTGSARGRSNGVNPDDWPWEVVDDNRPSAMPPPF